jgi:hypothetical protein
MYYIYTGMLTLEGVYTGMLDSVYTGMLTLEGVYTGMLTLDRVFIPGC